MKNKKTRPSFFLGKCFCLSPLCSLQHICILSAFSFFVYLFFFLLKLMAYVVEGRRSGKSRTGSRPSHRGYEKLKNINDVIPIDDANIISDKEVIILKS